MCFSLMRSCNECTVKLRNFCDRRKVIHFASESIPTKYATGWQIRKDLKVPRHHGQVVDECSAGHSWRVGID